MTQRFGPYLVGETIGRGTFGKVKLAVHEATKTKVALKIIPRRLLEQDQRSKIKITREITILRVLRHPNIMRLYDVVETTHDIVLILEYVSGGELFDFICKKSRLTEDVARHIFQQVVAALAYCHKYRVAHRDIKPENILMEQGSTRIKIGDFGLSSVIHDGCFFETSCGTPNYASPEVVSGKLYGGPEADVWSCGVLLYAMVVGALPFDDANVGVLFKKIQLVQYTMPGLLSQDLKDLLQRMLVANPLERATMEQVMRHPWVAPDFPPPLLALHYDAILDTARFGMSAKLIEENLEEDVVGVVASRFDMPLLDAYSIIAEEEGKALPYFIRAVVMCGDGTDVQCYPAANFFAKKANIVDAKLWPAPLVIPPAEQALCDREHDIHVSYLILLHAKQNRLYPEYMAQKGARSEMARSLIMSMSMNHGYGSLNANSLCQHPFLGLDSAPKSYQSSHYKNDFSNLLPSKRGDVIFTGSMIAHSQPEQNMSEGVVDAYMDGYNRLAESFIPLSCPASRHTLLGKLLGVVEHSAAAVEPTQSNWQAVAEQPFMSSSGGGDGGRALLQPLLKPLVGSAASDHTALQDDSVFFYPRSNYMASGGDDGSKREDLLSFVDCTSSLPFFSSSTPGVLQCEIVSRFGNDFLRNGVLFSFSTPFTTLQYLYEAMEEEGFLWKVIQPFFLAAVIHECVKLQVRVFKVTAEEQIVDVKVSTQSGMRGSSAAVKLLERLRRKAIAHAEKKLKKSPTVRSS